MNEKQLRILFQYGFITKSEQEKLLKKIRVDGLTKSVKIEILEKLGDNIRALREEEEKLLNKKIAAAKALKTAESSYHKELAKRYERILAVRKEEIWRRKKKKANDIREIFNEIERFDRELENIDEKIARELEKNQLADIRKRLL